MKYEFPMTGTPVYVIFKCFQHPYQHWSWYSAGSRDVSECTMHIHICSSHLYYSRMHSFVPVYHLFQWCSRMMKGKYCFFWTFSISPLDACAEGGSLTDTHFHCALNRHLDCAWSVWSLLYEYTSLCVESIVSLFSCFVNINALQLLLFVQFVLRSLLFYLFTRYSFQGLIYHFEIREN